MSLAFLATDLGRMIEANTNIKMKANTLLGVLATCILIIEKRQQNINECWEIIHIVSLSPYWRICIRQYGRRGKVESTTD